jgi:hypothetical protein
MLEGKGGVRRVKKKGGEAFVESVVRQRVVSGLRTQDTGREDLAFQDATWVAPRTDATTSGE